MNTQYSEGQISQGNVSTISPAQILLVLSAILTVTGIGFGLHAMILGHEHTFGTSREVPWGILIPSYVFFATISTGLCIIASLGQVFGIERFKPLVPRAIILAAITIAAGLMSISLELENPWRVPIYALFSPHPESNIWWKTSIFSMYLMLLVFNFILLLRNKPHIAKHFGLVALVACLATNLNMKEDMSMVGAHGFWPDQFMAIYFFALALVLGGCALILFNWIADKIGKDRMSLEARGSVQALGKLTATGLVIMAFFVGWKVLMGFSGGSEKIAVMQLLFSGKLAFSFWLGEVAMAVVIPLMIYFGLKKRSIGSLALFSTISLTGIFFTLYNMVIAGQLVPHFAQYNIVGLPKYYSYTPSLHEFMMFAGAVFLVMMLFIAGELYFRPSRLSVGR